MPFRFQQQLESCFLGVLWVGADDSRAMKLSADRVHCDSMLCNFSCSPKTNLTQVRVQFFRAQVKVRQFNLKIDFPEKLIFRRQAKISNWC